METTKLRSGIYSMFDSKTLHHVANKLKPKTILELGPREGRTTSVILEASKESITNYFIFEMQKPFLNLIKEWCLKEYGGYGMEFNFFGNIIDEDLSNIPKIDLLFIDGLHDYILARWYIKNLFPLTHEKSIIHIHDVYYGKNGNGWNDVGLKNNPQNHPDIISADVHKKLYPTIFEEYSDEVVTKFEEDEIRDFYEENRNSYNFFSTCYPKNVQHPTDVVPNCSLYLWKKNVELDKIFY